MANTYKYRLSGYIFETNVLFPELPEMPEETAIASMSVKKKFSTAIPKEALNTDSYTDNALHLRYVKLKHFGHVAIWNNRDVEFTPTYSMDDDTLRMLLLGSVSMMLSSVLGYVALHAACVVINDKAVLCCARSGKGKSSLAAYFYNEGYTVLSDDVTTLKISDNGLLEAYTSVPRFKLSEYSLNFFGKSSEGLNQMPTATKKYSLPFVPSDKLGYPVGAVIFPEFHNGKNLLVPITGGKKLNEISKHLYRKKSARLLGDDLSNNRNRVLYQLVKQANMHFFKRPQELVEMPESLAFIERELNRLCRISSQGER